MRQPAPSLTIDTPPCPICNRSVDVEPVGAAEYEFNCPDCLAWWNEDGSFAEWSDPDFDQCPSTNYNEWTRITHRCVLEAGHESAHGNGVVCGWTDRSAAPTPEGES